MYASIHKISLLIVAILLIAIPNYATGQSTSNWGSSPKNASVSANPSAPIIVYFKKPLKSKDLLNEEIFTVRTNGVPIKFALKIIAKSQIQLIPSNSWPENSILQVTQNKGIFLDDNTLVSEINFSFQTSKTYTTSLQRDLKIPSISPKITTTSINKEDAMPSTDLNDRLRKQIPFTVNSNNLVDEKRFYFLSTINYTGDKNRIQILDENGRIRFERYTSAYALDFKKLGAGLFSYFDWHDTCFYILNSSFVLIDTVKAGNGLITDNHEIKLDPKTGNYWLIAQEVVEMDLSKKVPGASSKAKILDNVIQEITPNKEVVFEWRPREYLPIEDAQGIDLFSSGIIDYIHCNSIDLDTDSTFLLSSRHLNEVERIDRRTGELIWRLGKTAREKAFDFINDPTAFSYQHDAKRLENGNILLFDNGNLRSGTRISRAVEYALDEDNRIAEMVWEYRNDLGTISDFMGSVQRLSNGNTIIGWGGTTPTFTEVNSSGEKIFEASSPLWSLSYRAYHFDIENEIMRLEEPITLPTQVNFCNKNFNQISATKRNVFKNYVNPNLVDSNWTVQMDNRQVVMATASESGVLTYANTPLQFGSMKLATKDTQVCSTSPKVFLPLTGDCILNGVSWSDGSKEAYITLDPSIEGSRSVWVNYLSGEELFSDTFYLKVVELPNFEIFGKRKFNEPWEIATYSAPYYPNYSYSWEVENGHIISGFGTNSVQIQWGSSDSGNVSVTLTNSINCQKTAYGKIEIPSQTNALGENSSLNSVSVFPNPIQNQFTVRSLNPIEKIYLKDLSGRQIMEFTSDLHLENQRNINVESIARGIYVLEIHSGKQKITKQIILTP